MYVLDPAGRGARIPTGMGWMRAMRGTPTCVFVVRRSELWARDGRRTASRGSLELPSPRGSTFSEFGRTAWRRTSCFACHQSVRFVAPVVQLRPQKAGGSEHSYRWSTNVRLVFGIVLTRKSCVCLLSRLVSFFFFFNSSNRNLSPLLSSRAL